MPCLAKIKAIPGAEISELDGVTARCGDWWCNVRASNTEPVCRLNLEANTAELMDAKIKEISELINSCCLTSLWFGAPNSKLAFFWKYQSYC